MCTGNVAIQKLFLPLAEWKCCQEQIEGGEAHLLVEAGSELLCWYWLHPTVQSPHRHHQQACCATPTQYGVWILSNLWLILLISLAV